MTLHRDEVAVRRYLMLRCCRLVPMYSRCVAAASIACMICVAHLLVYQALLATQTTDIVTAGHQLIDDDDYPMDSSHTSTTFNEHAFDSAISHDNGACDVLTRKDPDDANHSARYRFNCSNIGGIVLRQQIGHGVTKRVYLGHSVDDDDGPQRQVAVKMVTRKSMDVTRCVQLQQVKQDAIGRQRCFIPANMKLMKEILLLNQLRHRGIMPLLGYCVRSEESESTSLQDHGVLAVYEYGTHFYATSMRDWPINRRLDTAIQLADLAVYLRRSPLGSLRVADFKQTHFLLLDRGRRIAMTDLDDVTSAELSCDNSHVTYSIASQPTVAPTSCPYGLQCIGGQCQGYNAIHNLDHFNRLFFRHLLHTDDAERWLNRRQVDCLKSILSAVSDPLNAFALSADQLQCQLHAAQRCSMA